MSIQLPTVNLSGYAVGTGGVISLAPAGLTANLKQYTQPAHVQIYNESGSGLSISFTQGSDTTFLPAGGWTTLPLAPGESAINFRVTYILSNPPVSTLVVVYFAPGEPVPAIATLGNSPVGGGVSTSSVQELLNTGQAPGTPIINAQPSDAASATWTADNSGNLTVKGDNAGTLTTLLQLIAGASPEVILAAAGILTYILGNFQVDGTATFNGTIDLTTIGQIVLSSGNVSIKATNGTAHLQLSTSTTAGDVFDAIPSGATYVKGFNAINFQIPNGTTQATLSSTGRFTANGGFALAAGTGVQYQMYVGGMSRINNVTGTGSQSVNHNLGATPSYATAICNAAGSSQTQGVTYNSTQVTVTSGASLTWDCLILRY